MIDRVCGHDVVRAVSASVVLLALAASACRDVPRDPLTLEGNRLTVDNRTSQEWRGVEIWLNRYYRVTAASIPPGGRLQAPLDVFVAGFGQRFDFRRMQVRDLRLTATLPDGKPLEITKTFEAHGLGATLGKAVGAGGKR
jgi:hypothetical protein